MSLQVKIYFVVVPFSFLSLLPPCLILLACRFDKRFC